MKPGRSRPRRPPGATHRMRMFQRFRFRKFGSIFLRNLVQLSLLILVPILLVIWLANYSVSIFIEKEIQSYSSRSIQVYKKLTEDRIEAYLNTMVYLSGDPNIVLFLLQNTEPVTLYDRALMNKQMEVIMRTEQALQSVYVYSSAGEKVFSNYGEVLLKNLPDTEWLEVHENGGNRTWTHMRQHADHLGLKTNILSMYLSMEIPKDEPGTIVFEMNFDRFAKQMRALRHPSDEGLFLVDSGNNLLAAAWGDFGALATPEALAGLAGSDTYVRSGDYMLYRTEIAMTDWAYISAVPIQEYYNNIDFVRRNIFTVITLGVLAVVIITVIVSMRIYSPIRKIMMALGLPAALVDPDKPFRPDEETYIIDTITSNLQSTKKISQELDERVKLLKHAQSVALQSQINPHFLYNTLDSINWSAMRLTGGPNETSDMLGKLSAQMRYALEEVEVFVPLEKELANTKTYLELQSLRYRDKFEVVWDVDEELLPCKVIKLILQPLVENAISHGIKPMAGKGTIEVSAAMDEAGFLVLAVRDSGIGMSPARLHALKSKLAEPTIQQREHIGIVNVHQRIRLLYGDGYGLTVESAQEQGTTVLVRLPVEV